MTTEKDISMAAAALGRRGGSAKSRRKAAASAANGALGGRPAAWEAAARKRSGYIFLHLNIARDDQGKTWRESRTLWLEPDGSIRIEDERLPSTVLIGWRDENGREYPRDHLTEYQWLTGQSRRRNLDEARVEIAATGDLARGDDEHTYRPIRRPLTDDELAAERAKIIPEMIGSLGDWPSETFMGIVELAGSRDRWICSLGVGGHKDHLPGAYGTAAQAEAALRGVIADRQARIERIITKRCAPHAVRCAFPKIKIETRADPAQAFEPRPNRRERRAGLQRDV